MRYLDGVADPTSYREVFTVAAHELDYGDMDASRRVHEYFEDEYQAAELPFERSLEDTPAFELYLHAGLRADDERGRRADSFRRAGQYASATLYEARSLVSLRAFEEVIDAIDAGEYGPPGVADRLATEREAAVAALTAAWNTKPSPVTNAVALPARNTLERGIRKLELVGPPTRSRRGARVLRVRQVVRRGGPGGRWDGRRPARTRPLGAAEFSMG